MGNIVRMTYDGNTLPEDLKSWRPRFLLEAIPEILEIKNTTVNGMQAMIVTSVIEATTTIFQEAQGGLDIEGASTGTGIHFVGSDGRYLGGTRSAVTELEVSGPAIPAVIPVTAETELVVELLP